jgi:multisubunit Na+/H+ antiporter MnhE subunit
MIRVFRFDPTRSSLIKRAALLLSAFLVSVVVATLLWDSAEGFPIRSRPWRWLPWIGFACLLAGNLALAAALTTIGRAVRPRPSPDTDRQIDPRQTDA